MDLLSKLCSNHLSRKVIVTINHNHVKLSVQVVVAVLVVAVLSNLKIPQIKINSSVLVLDQQKNYPLHNAILLIISNLILKESLPLPKT
jgi:hypothetical protein